jgi:hypothetical protein
VALNTYLVEGYPTKEIKTDYRQQDSYKTSILRVLQAIPSPLPVVYSIKIVQAEQN